MLWIVPLLFAVALVAPVLLAPVSRRADLFVSRLALPIFGIYVSNNNSRRLREEELLRAAYVGETHRVYAARTLLMATLFAISGSIIGVYVVGGALWLLAPDRGALAAALPAPLTFLSTLTNPLTASPAALFVLLLVSSAVLGTTLAVGTYWGRWTYLRQKANARAREIDATLPRTVAFVYALSRSGMSFPDVLDTLTRNQQVYGEAAREFGVAVREMNAFGTNVLTALQRMASRTPSDGLEEFGENLASVLGSGRSLSEFLREQYDQYQDEAETQQEQYLDLLATFAEVYVTVFVAGPLFFVTVLVIVGLVIQSTITLTRVVGYVGIPLASAAFLVYIDNITESLGAPEGEAPDRDVEHVVAGGAEVADGGAATADGGTATGPDRWRANRERLAAYDRFVPVRKWVSHPVQTLADRPGVTFAVTVPAALVWVGYRLGSPPAEPIALLKAVDEPLMEGALLVMSVFAVVYELKKRRTTAIENAIPDFLDRLASVNEAGMTIVESIGRVTRSDLGALTPEIQRTWQDIQWGTDAQTALRRLDQRTESLAVTRSVTLITNAMRASGNIAPVLRIAADEAHEARRLRRERRQEMFTYLMVIYIAFLVFIGIIVALALAFIPAVEQAGVTGGGGAAPTPGIGGGASGLFSNIGDVNTEAYTLTFFHIAAIQALCSGLIAGQLGEGDMYGGFKHATVLLGLAYVVFVVL